MSMQISRIWEASGLGCGVGGRVGGNCRQSWIVVLMVGSQSRLQAVGSSMIILRVLKHRIPYRVALGDRCA